MTTHHEGEALRALLKRSKVQQADFAKAAGVKPSAVTKYLAEDTIGDRAWKTVRDGLKTLNLDPSEIRQEPTVMARERAPQGRDFTPALTAWPKDHLRTLREVLLAGPDERAAVAWWIKGKLDG